ARQDVLAAYDSPSAASIAAAYKDPEHRWAGTALRMRVIAVTDHAAGAPARGVKGLADLTNPALKGKIAMARPGAGTTGGHVAAMYLHWGDEKAAAFFRSLRANEIKLLGGNSD